MRGSSPGKADSDRAPLTCRLAREFIAALGVKSQCICKAAACVISGRRYAVVLDGGEIARTDVRSAGQLSLCQTKLDAPLKDSGANGDCDFHGNWRELLTSLVASGNIPLKSQVV